MCLTLVQLVSICQMSIRPNVYVPSNNLNEFYVFK
jgi:hypothetical protein